MKRILFFIESLQCGGAERSLISLLENLPENRYEIDILVLKKGGGFEHLLPKWVTYKSLDMQVRIGPRIKFKLFRLYDIHKKFHNAQKFWQAIGNTLPVYPQKYDIAVGWGQGFATYYVAEKVSAEKKIAWVNIDYNRVGYDKKTDIKKYDKIDCIVCVSEFVSGIMQEFIKKDKVITITDIIDESDVLKGSQCDQSEIIKGETETVIVSVGRLATQKKFELSIESARLLDQKGLDFKWYIIGEGKERLMLEGLISQYNLADKVFLLGFKNNPYPYINACDIYVQTSRFEGLGRTLIEAAILNKPVVTTNFPTAFSILDPDETGVIVEMEAEAVSKGIERYISDRPFREKIIQNLKKRKDNNREKTLNQVYSLFDN